MVDSRQEGALAELDAARRAVRAALLSTQMHNLNRRPHRPANTSRHLDDEDSHGRTRRTQRA